MSDVIKPEESPYWFQSLAEAMLQYPGVSNVELFEMENTKSVYRAYCHFNCSKTKTLWAIASVVGCSDIQSGVANYTPTTIDVVPISGPEMEVEFSFALPELKEHCELDVPLLTKSLNEFLPLFRKAR